ncbi:class 1 fructose-bisphosphatase [Rhodoblastus sp.]|jgi:fructose-1,6-bisphosphatase I|uniref:class 1 fructose-bisphosphatase n=1 Tax=Rhodoblastus sp. TaxID=1962975 RepID=UPI002618C1A4|nr:class 1 fructose-bisphosphatase [Rhodoblastus sp.]
MTSKDSPAANAGGESLDDFLKAWAAAGEGRDSLARTVAGLAQAGIALSEIIAGGPLSGALGSEVGGQNADGDKQRQLDVIADGLIIDALRKTPTAFYASEEEEAILTLDPTGEYAVACDPLDGSSNIDCNMPIATIFGVFRATPGDATASFFRKGEEQVAAGYVIYGPQTGLLLTLGEGVAQFTLDPASRRFILISPNVRIAPTTREYAINASNYRHWPDQIRAFIDDCVEGETGPHGKDFNMRWLACMVGEAHRIFSRGGVFLYPGDDRAGYQRGRLRLLYEAFPVAMLVEQAGGGATDGLERILAKKLDKLHQRTPLVFGSIEKVARIASYYSDAHFQRAHSPLFGERGLFHN